MFRYFFALFVACTFIAGCATPKGAAVEKDTLPANTLVPFGRTVLDRSQNLELISSASHVGFSFEGESCRIIASVPSWLSHNYLQYEVDGAYRQRVRVTSKEGEPIIITAPGSGRHTVWLYKATEAHTGSVIIHRISGNKITALHRPEAPLIEFIGNSITCGATADPSEVPCGTGVYHDQHNALMAYGPRVARALDVNYLLSCVSGIGAYRNWNSDGPTMPQVYEKIDFQDRTEATWNFSVYSPRVVSIALGTNDFSRGDGKKERLLFDSAKFVTAYVDFVRMVQVKYPSAQIALLSSPMINGEARVLFQNCLRTVKASVDAKSPSQKKLALFFFDPMQASGCTGHPSVEEHGTMAAQLIPFFKNFLQ